MQAVTASAHRVIEPRAADRPSSVPVQAVAARTDDGLPPLDGLRALALLLVMGMHVAYLSSIHARGTERLLLQRTFGVWSFGNYGVQLFFVLSGFLLFRPHAREMLGGPPGPRVTTYFGRRARRVLPAYWISLGLFVIAIVPLTGGRVGPRDVILHLLLVHNASAHSYTSINSVFWTMAVEVQFYALLPLIAAGLVRLARRNVARAVAALVAATVVVTPLTVAVEQSVTRLQPGVRPYVGLLSVPAFFATFGGGMLAALLDQWIRRSGFAEGAVWWARAFAMGGAAALAVALGQNLRHQLPPGGDYALELTLGLAFAGVLTGCLHVWPAVGRALSARTLRWLATTSYSLYIWHLAIYTFVVMPLVLRLSPGAVLPGMVMGTVIVLALGRLSYRVTERPFLARAARHPRPAAATELHAPA